MNTTYDKIKNLDGFKVGNYFVTFPPGNFIKEDSQGNTYIEVEIYSLQKDGTAVKLPKNSINPEIDRIISEELNKLVNEALQQEKGV